MHRREMSARSNDPFSDPCRSRLGQPGLPAWAQQEVTTDVGTPDRGSAEKAFQKPPCSPYAGRNFPTRPFFGDARLHTSFSMNAGTFGARLGPCVFFLRRGLTQSPYAIRLRLRLM